MKGTRGAAALLLSVYVVGASADCTVSVTGVNFGSYHIFDLAPTDSSGDIEVSCQVATPYIIKLDAGGNNPGSYFPRKLYNTFNASTLEYNLYLDNGYNLVWGDGLSGTFTVSAGGLTDLFRVYGRIPAGQNVGEGTYSDAVTVLVEW